jgi:DNA sulfur modification protein DndC
LGKLCLACLGPHLSLHEATVRRVQAEYLASNAPWVLGFSGGKDSSALLRLIYTAIRRLPSPVRPITVVYCDTGVDIPVISQLVRRTLVQLASEAVADRLPMTVRVARPRLNDRYFVKVIGRGYPPPTNKFRWCTDRLRIDPVQRIVRSLGKDSRCTVLLGVRRTESLERDRTIARHRLRDPYKLRQDGGVSSVIYAPLLDYDTPAIWSALHHFALPRCVNVGKLVTLYKDAGAECPILRDPRGTPCGVGRFGCWTCTVVRRDKAVSSMINEGHSALAPLYDFRNWLTEVRADPRRRCRGRRNGQPGPGPFTLAARRAILSRLLLAQRQVPWTLITKAEVRRIRQLWREDLRSAAYRRIERAAMVRHS